MTVLTAAQYKKKVWLLYNYNKMIAENKICNGISFISKHDSPSALRMRRFPTQNYQEDPHHHLLQNYPITSLIFEKRLKRSNKIQVPDIICV
jgi:hypothetical protein